MPKFTRPTLIRDFHSNVHYTLMGTDGVPWQTVVVPLQLEDGTMRAEAQPGFSAQTEAIEQAEANGFEVIDWFDATTLIVTPKEN